MKLLSGGQSGVDRGGARCGIERSIDYGGWCPKDGWAEDLSAPPGLLAKYPNLKETPLPDPAQRTEWNVRDADACMIVIAAGGLAVSKARALAEELAHRFRKPLLVVDLGDPEPVEHAALWCACSSAGLAPIWARIGGPRENEAPGIYASATAFIHALLDWLLTVSARPTIAHRPLALNVWLRMRGGAKRIA